MELGCGHKLHTRCAEKLCRRGDNQCPECLFVFTMLLRPESPKDKLKDLKIQNSQYLQEIVTLKRQLKKEKEEKKMWEQEARSLWGEFVTKEMIKSNFFFNGRLKKYI